MRRLRVLAIAEAANPEWVSVPLVGWSLATALREVADVHIVTQVRNREAFLRAGMIEGNDFTAIDSEAFARPLWAIGEKLRMGQGKGWTMVQMINAISYPYFERLVWKEFGDRIQSGAFDIVHRITPLSPTISSPIAKKVADAGVPFVLGPLNGGVPWPKGFDAERRREKEWLSYIRSAYKALPGRDATLRHASAILAGSHHTASEVPPRFAEKLVYLPENGINPTRFSGTADPPKTGPLQACFVGRMVPYKGPDMLLDAAEPLLRDGTLHLQMIGDGPLQSALQDRNLPNITWHGWMAHDAVQTVLKNCHLMAFPSIREFGGGVVLEAMALGVPPLIVDYAGPGELVTDETGLKIPLGDRAAIVASFNAELTRLTQDRSDLAALGDTAKTHVANHFTWPQKARQIARVYNWVTSQSPKPSFFGPVNTSGESDL